MDILYFLTDEFTIEAILINLLVLVGMFLFIKLVDYVRDIPFESKNRFLNIHNYFPEDEVHTLFQIGYLLLSGIFMIMLVYIYTIIYETNLFFAIIDLTISLFVIIFIFEKDSKISMFWTFCLIPFNSLIYMVAGYDYTLWVTLILHILGYAYAAYFFFRKFYDYTKNHNLGLTILLLYIILFLSLFVTVINENVALIDALVMISNAFTSNGYAVLGSTMFGKIDSLFLVWGGYILSGVGTATLAAAIMSKFYHNQNKKLEAKIDELEEKIDELIKKMD